MIQKPSLLVSAVNMIDELPLAQGDTKGDLYEYLLSWLTTAGINGQFRTPRHIIRLMVDLWHSRAEADLMSLATRPAAPAASWPAMMEHLMEKYTSPEGS